MDNHWHYDFRDIIWAPARALSAKKIFVMTLFLCLALLFYDLFTYLALAISTDQAGYVWSAYGMFPYFDFGFDNTGGWIVFSVGVVLALMCLMMGFFGVAAFQMEEVRGNRFMSIWQAVRFAFKRLPQLFLSELAIALFVAFIVLLFALCGLLCRIPIIGAWIYSVFFVVPSFIAAIFTVFIILVFQISWLLLPAAAAADRVGEAFTAILETFSTVIRRPAQWLVYTAYSLVAAKICSFIYAYFCYRSVQFIGWASGLTGGARMTDRIKAGLAHLPVGSDTVRETFNLFPGVEFGVSMSRWTRGGSGDELTSYVMAIMLFLIFASIVGYFLAIIATAQARAYVVIRYKKDDYEISAESPLFFEDEPVNPPVGQDESADE